MKKQNIEKFAVYDDLARAYKAAFLNGDSRASVYLESLLDDDNFRRMIAKYNLRRGSFAYDRIDCLSDEEYVNVVVAVIFMDKNNLRMWHDTDISILGFIYMNSQPNGYIGLAVEKTLNSIRSSYTQNYRTVFTSVTSTQVPAQASRPDGPTVEDALRSGQNVAAEAIHDGDLDDESDIAHLVQMYDPSKGAPGTYFSLAIQNALYTETLKKEGRNRPQNQLIRNLKNLIDEYEKCGKTPTIESISKDLGKTPKQVRDILCLIGISEAACLDELKGFQDGIFSGDASRDEAYRVPEEAVVEKVSSEELYEKLRERMTEKETEILKCIYNGTSYTKCGISKSEYRAFIKKCTDIIANDEDIHSLLWRD